MILRSLNLTPPVSQPGRPTVPPLLMPGEVQNGTESRVPQLMALSAFDPFAASADTPSTVSPSTPTSALPDLPPSSLNGILTADGQRAYQTLTHDIDYLRSTPFTFDPRLMSSRQLPYTNEAPTSNFANYIGIPTNNEHLLFSPATSGTATTDSSSFSSILGSKSPSSPLFARSPSPYWRHLPESYGTRTDGWVPSVPADTTPSHTDEHPIPRGPTQNIQSWDGMNSGRSSGIDSHQRSGLANISYSGRPGPTFGPSPRRQELVQPSESPASSQFKGASLPNRIAKDYQPSWTTSSHDSNSMNGNQGLSSSVSDAPLYSVR